MPPDAPEDEPHNTLKSIRFSYSPGAFQVGSAGGGKTSSTRWELVFPADGRRYITFVQSGAARSPTREQRFHPRVRITYARFGGVPGLIMFTGVSLLGAPSGGGTVTFTAGGAVLCVRVQPATGRARIDDAGCP